MRPLIEELPRHYQRSPQDTELQRALGTVLDRARADLELTMEQLIPSTASDPPEKIGETMAKSSSYTAPIFGWRCCDLMAQAAAVLGREADAAFYQKKAAAMKKAIAAALIDGCGMGRDRVMGTDYFYKNPKALLIGKFRTETSPALRRTEDDFTVYEIVSLVKGALEERVALYMDELTALLQGVFPELRVGERFQAFLRDCIAYGEEKGLFVRSVSDRISLA